MMQLPALSAEERAQIASGWPDDAVRELAERIRLHFQATFGIRMLVVGSHAVCPLEPFTGSEPAINIDAALASAWLDLRYGGRLTGYVGGGHDQAWNVPLIALVRRALAEAVVNHDEINRDGINRDGINHDGINHGEHASWPQAMQIQLQTGSLVGTINISWNSEHVCRWSRQHLGIAAKKATEKTTERGAKI